MHKKWCGKSCTDCKHPCKLIDELYCNPDCEYLGANGETDSPECKSCDAYLAFIAGERPYEFSVDLSLLPQGEGIGEDIAESISNFITETTGWNHHGFLMNVTVNVSNIDYQSPLQD